MSDRPGFDAMQAEIAASGGRFGGCWGPLDMGTYCPRAVELLLALFPVRTVLDVGCGFGAQLRLFRAMGVQAIGVEPLAYASTRCGLPVIRHDLEHSPLWVDGIDLTFSVEAAEHIYPTDHFTRTMSCGKVAFFSAAPPGLDGHHHVSLHPEEYWVRMMKRERFVFQPKLSQKLRDAAGGYVGMSGMLFVRESYLDESGLLRGDYE